MTEKYRRGRRAATAIALIVAGVLVLTGASTLAGIFKEAPPAKAASQVPRSLSNLKLPPPVKPAFVPRNPDPLHRQAGLSRWAPVQRAVAARALPTPSGPVVSRLSTKTPEGTNNIVSVVGSKESKGRIWVHVRLPVLPNGTLGWVPRSALGGYGFLATRLVVNLHSFRAVLYRGRKRIFEAPVGVGKPSSPTPTGTFYIRDRVAGFSDPFYGPIAFGTSARSATLTDWPGGGFIGIHGTDQPALIPGAISHGCIRMRNHDIQELARLMPVGTPVVIR